VLSRPSVKRANLSDLVRISIDVVNEENPHRAVQRPLLVDELRHVRNSFATARWRGCSDADCTPNPRATFRFLSGSIAKRKQYEYDYKGRSFGHTSAPRFDH
jgi:hypothetical protein